MNRFITHTIKLAVFVAMFFVGAQTFAASFDSQPLGSSGFTTINSCETTGCANQTDTVSYNSLSNGEFTVFINFRNDSPGTINNAQGRFSYDTEGTSSSTQFTGTLSGSNASTRTDTARITNLPDSWEIRFLSGEVYVDDRFDRETGTVLCSAAFPSLNIPFERNVSSPTSNTFIDNLTYGDHQGWCQQGYIEAHFQVVDTSSNDTYDWYTGDWGQCVNGVEERDVQCRDQNNNVVADSLCSGSKPAETRSCPDDNLVVKTDNPTNIGETSATFNGDLISGGPADQYFFVFSSSDATPECSLTSNDNPVSAGSVGGGSNPTFNRNQSGLQSNTTYYYRACAENDGIVAEGVVRKFTTGGDSNNEYDWYTGPWGQCINDIEERVVECRDQNGNEVNDNLCGGDKPDDQRDCADLVVETDSPTNIGQDSVTFNGDLISGGPADQYFFVFSSSDATPECSFSSNDNIVFATDIGSNDNPNFDRDQEGLQSNTTYYYRACAELDGEIVFGDVEQFTTDNDGGSGNNNDRPDVDTEGPDDVDEDSAELNGNVDMNDFDNGIVFFVYGQDENMVEDVDNEYDTYDDVKDDEDGDDFQVVRVDTDLDNERDYAEDVSGLDTNERYYYQICVEYEDEDGDDRVECGGVEDFRTDNDDDDDDDDDEVEIVTLTHEDFGDTYATLCGDLEDNGGDRGLRTLIEIRRSNGGSWVQGGLRQRGEGRYCVDVNDLQPNTQYEYRACTDEGDCGVVRRFRTNPRRVDLPPVTPVIVNTLDPSNIGTSSAILNGVYQGSPAEPTRMWFEWGRTPALGTQKQVFTRSAPAGQFSDSFTGLSSCTVYYYRAVAENSLGRSYGNTLSFRTACPDPGGTVVVRPPRVEVVEEVEEVEIDLDRLGFGLSLIRLEIDDNQQSVGRDQLVTYEVRWENISTIDLGNIDIKATVPPEIQITGVSRGRIDADDNAVLFTIEELESEESGSMTISGIVTNGAFGDVLTAEVTAAYDNPINEAQENATDYDVDEFVLNGAFGTASVFGLSNITFLGWLTILLGLLIIFLIARWIYLEREELRAQAYATGYRPAVYGDPRYDYDRGPAYLGSASAPGYDDPYYRDHRAIPPAAPAAPDYTAPQAPQAPVNDGYEPYRPNRG